MIAKTWRSSPRRHRRSSENQAFPKEIDPTRIASVARIGTLAPVSPIIPENRQSLPDWNLGYRAIASTRRSATGDRRAGLRIPGGTRYGSSSVSILTGMIFQSAPTLKPATPQGHRTGRTLRKAIDLSMENTSPASRPALWERVAVLEGSAFDLVGRARGRSRARPVAGRERFRSPCWIGAPRPWLFPRRAGRCRMSVAIRSKRPLSAEFTSNPPSSTPSPHLCHVTEAPERGECAREAPETRAGRSAEAPDAGERRAGTLEHEFTHGRSQS